MAAEMMGHMMPDEMFIPTMISDYPNPGEEVEGAVMVQMTCKALLAGQALLSVGGYIVRGVKKSCGRRAIAIRLPDGAFEMVLVQHYSVVGREPGATAPATASTAGIGSQVLAIIGTPSPSTTPDPQPTLLQELDDQAQREAQIDTAQLPPVQQRIQSRQQMIDDNESTRLSKPNAGKLPVTNIMDSNESVTIINTLLDKVIHLEQLLQKYISGNGANSSAAAKGSTTTPLHARIDTISFNNTTDNDKVDGLQGFGDSWRQSLGHADLRSKLRAWATEVTESGKWPKPQVLAGNVRDIISMVQVEVDNIKREQTTNGEPDDKLNDVTMVIQQHIGNNNGYKPTQGPPDSKPSGSPDKHSIDGDIGDQILAQIGLNNDDGHGGNGHGDDLGDEFANNRGGNYNITGGGGTRKNEFISVKPRTITIVSSQEET